MAVVIVAMLYGLDLGIPILQVLPYNLYYIILPFIPIIYLFRPSTLKEFLKV